jgi:hypothetical protein
MKNKCLSISYGHYHLGSLSSTETVEDHAIRHFALKNVALRAAAGSSRTSPG